MNELQKPNGGAVVMQPATTTPAFNFFDPVQFETMQRVCSFFASSDLVPENYKATLKPFPPGANEETIKAIKAENTAIKTKEHGGDLWSPIMVIQVLDCNRQFVWSL